MKVTLCIDCIDNQKIEWVVKNGDSQMVDRFFAWARSTPTNDRPTTRCFTGFNWEVAGWKQEFDG